MSIDTMPQQQETAAHSTARQAPLSKEEKEQGMALLAAIMQKSVPQRLTLSDLVTGNNPRKHFDQVEMDELVATVKVVGVIQPILVRPVEEGKYEIIAGERRVRASLQVFGETGTILAVVAEVTKEQAELLALIENIARAPMSPMEEAAAAYRELLRNDNDKEEVALVLGWSSSKLESRLALLRCVPEVRKALNERKIKLGIAELLAALPGEKQESALGKILEHNLSVEYVKQFIQRAAHRLEVAVFDKSDCLSCQFNSECQSALFAEALTNGYCTNGACYDKKTNAALEAIKTELSQDYPVIKIVALGDAVTAIPIVAEGKMGVGAEQASACRGCQNYGCTVSALPESMGQVEKGVCFDAACNTTKVAAHLRTVKAGQGASAGASAPGTKTKPTASGSKGAATPTAKKPKATVQTPTKVKEYRVKLWRDVAKKELLARPAEALTVLVGLSVIGSARNISGSKMADAFKKLLNADGSVIGSDLGEVLAAIHANDRAKTKMLEALSASAMGEIDERQLVMTLTFLQADIAKHWNLCAEYLNLMTKSEIEAVAEELGLKTALGDKFGKLAGGKKDEFVNALLKVEGFDYSRAVPAVLIYGHKDAAALVPQVLSDAPQESPAEGQASLQNDTEELETANEE